MEPVRENSALKLQNIHGLQKREFSEARQPEVTNIVKVHPTRNNLISGIFNRPSKYNLRALSNSLRLDLFHGQHDGTVGSAAALQ